MVAVGYAKNNTEYAITNTGPLGMTGNVLICSGDWNTTANHRRWLRAHWKRSVATEPIGQCPLKVLPPSRECPFCTVKIDRNPPGDTIKSLWMQLRPRAQILARVRSKHVRGRPRIEKFRD
jgi:hypothetical protein